MQVHLLEYNDDTGVLDKTAFPHSAGDCMVAAVILYSVAVLDKVPMSCVVSGEIWDIAACPSDSGLLATVFSSVSSDGCRGGVGVWRLEEEGEGEGEEGDGEGEGGKLAKVCQFSHDSMPKW